MIDTGYSILNTIIGGFFISLATSIHLLLKGKITGYSGIFFNLITGTDFLYNFCFLLGTLITPSYILLFNKSSFTNFENKEYFISDLNIFGFIFSGLLVGIGTKMGNGCTSGHGVCGIPRLSIRSIVAVCMFMITGITTSTLNPKLNFFSYNSIEIPNIKIPYLELIIFLFCLICIILILIIDSKGIYAKKDLTDHIISFIVGILFAFGLIQSGMIGRHKVIGFLCLNSNWDYSLMFVLGSAVGFNLITFHYILNLRKPIFNRSFEINKNKTIDLKLMIGAGIFGIGWGMGGICPGPSLVISFFYLPYSIIFLFMVAIGQLIENSFDSMLSQSLSMKNHIE
jgi:uncharacterized membrane protein YedE/YeeE